ncbi:C-type lection lectoxin-Enh3-like [Zeugodacus cucurbitae]|nr:C-type lection lectoxin-Enh3-like [Zeugodacus cucurbitae]
MKGISLLVLSLLGLAAYCQSSPTIVAADDNEVQLIDPYLRFQPSEDRRANGSNVAAILPMNQKFFLSPDKLSWYEANYYCGLANLKLVSLNSPSLEAELKGFLSFYGLQDKFYWTGGNRFNTQKNWVWGLNGYSFSYARWAENEPSNDTIHNNCMAAWIKRDEWFTIECDGEFDFICQK